MICNSQKLESSQMSTSRTDGSWLSVWYSPFSRNLCSFVGDFCSIGLRGPWIDLLQHLRTCRRLGLTQDTVNRSPYFNMTPRWLMFERHCSGTAVLLGVDPGVTALASLRRWWEMQILRPHPQTCWLGWGHLLKQLSRWCGCKPGSLRICLVLTSLTSSQVTATLKAHCLQG